MQERHEQRKRPLPPHKQPERADTPKASAPSGEQKNERPVSESLVENLKQNGF